MPGVPASQAIGGGFRASYAIDNEGVVWSWGDNSDGQLGDNTTTSHSLAARIPSPANDDFFRLSGTDTRPDVFSFNPAFGVTPITQTGSNVITVGGLRNGVSSPVTVTGGEVSINGGAFSAVGASVVNGNTVQVRAMSSSAFSTTTQATVTIGGATGRSSTFYVRTRRDATARSVRPQAAAGNGHSFTLTPAGNIVAAGYNGNGQLANGTTFSSPQLRAIGGLSGVVLIASGDYHGLALKNDGTLLAWGYNASGQLGDGTDANPTLSFSNVSGLTQVELVRRHQRSRRADGDAVAAVDAGRGRQRDAALGRDVGVEAASGGGDGEGVLRIVAAGVDALVAQHALAIVPDIEVVVDLDPRLDAQRLRRGDPLGDRAREMELFGELAQAMRDASICGLGQTASTAIASALALFDPFPSGPATPERAHLEEGS